MSANDPSVANRVSNQRSLRSLIQQVRRMLVILLVTIVGALALLAYCQRYLIYGPKVTSRLTTSDIGLERSAFDVTVQAHDGLNLHGWLVLAKSSTKADSDDAKQTLADQRPVVMYFPGNAGNRGYRLSQLQCLRLLDVHTLLVDYRGYGDNPGRPTEADLARDARSAWEFLTKNLGVAPDRIVIYGESLGGGVATRLASELCQEGLVPAGLIAQSTFDSLVAAAQFHYPYLPVSWLLVDRFPSVVRMPHVTCPVLSIHGTRDSIVPFVNGKRLFDAAPAVSKNGVAKRMLVLPQTGHNDVYGGEDNAELVNELARFFEERADEVDQPAASDR